MKSTLHAILMTAVWLAPATSAVAQKPRRPLSEEAQKQVESVLPAKAPAAAKEARKLLIYDGNVGYGGHASIPYANYAFTRMGEKTGAFTTVVSRDPAVFKKDQLEQFDAVCLNNTVGNLFTDRQLRQNLLEFVLSGGGLLGIHGTTVAFTDFGQGARETWPEFGQMIGARGAAHLAQDERVVVKIDAPDHPLTRPFGGKGFEHVSEFFRAHGTYAQIPGDEAGCRKVFEFGRKMGIETFISEPPPESLDVIERFCDQYDINLAIHNHGPKQSPVYWRPEGILDVCKGRSKRVGACPDTGYWIRAGIDPIEGIRKLGDRLITIQPHDLNELSSEGHDVPWGTGKAEFEKLLQEIRRAGIRPMLIGLEYSYDFLDNMPEMAECVEFINRLKLDAPQ